LHYRNFKLLFIQTIFIFHLFIFYHNNLKRARSYPPNRKVQLSFSIKAKPIFFLLAFFAS